MKFLFVAYITVQGMTAPSLTVTQFEDKLTCEAARVQAQEQMPKGVAYTTYCLPLGDHHYARRSRSEGYAVQPKLSL